MANSEKKVGGELAWVVREESGTREIANSGKKTIVKLAERGKREGETKEKS